MKSSTLLKLSLGAAAGVLMACAVAPAMAAGPAEVAGPAEEAQCYVPWAADTKFIQYPAKPGPYRIALANGYIANTWRIQMIQTAKAYAAQPDIAAKLKEFKVVSTGEGRGGADLGDQQFIDSGYDAIVTDAQNPEAFAQVIKRAKDAGVVLVAFDNILNTTDDINVNVDQRAWASCGANGSSTTCRTAARCWKCAASPAPRSIPTATTASTRRSMPRARPGTSSKSSANGMTRRPRR